MGFDWLKKLFGTTTPQEASTETQAEAPAAPADTEAEPMTEAEPQESMETPAEDSEGGTEEERQM